MFFAHSCFTASRRRAVVLSCCRPSILILGGGSGAHRAWAQGHAELSPPASGPRPTTRPVSLTVQAKLTATDGVDDAFKIILNVTASFRFVVKCPRRPAAVGGPDSCSI